MNTKVLVDAYTDLSPLADVAETLKCALTEGKFFSFDELEKLAKEVLAQIIKEGKEDFDILIRLSELHDLLRGVMAEGNSSDDAHTTEDKEVILTQPTICSYVATYKTRALDAVSVAKQVSSFAQTGDKEKDMEEIKKINLTQIIILHQRLLQLCLLGIKQRQDRLVVGGEIVSAVESDTKSINML